MAWKTAEYAVGEEVWLYPDNARPNLRQRCRITEVHEFGVSKDRLHTILYDTDYTWIGKHRVWDEGTGRFIEESKVCHAVGLSPRWLAPLSAIDRLGDLAPL